MFYAYRVALPLMVEMAPRPRLELDDLLAILMAWLGALPPETQVGVAKLIGAHVADTINGEPFHRRAPMVRGGGPGWPATKAAPT